MQWKWYVYILECSDGTYYTGRTWKPDLRWTQHLSGFGAHYTRLHPPKELVYLEEYELFVEARQREKQIKSWSRKKKLNLIRGEWGKW
jgi:putative endonuclease